MMQSILNHNPQQNYLLAALAAEEIARISTRLELVHLRLGDMLYEPNTQLLYAYFPTTAIISLYYVTVTGASSEIAGVGNEGMLGVSLFLGSNTALSSAVVQATGHAYRLERSILREEFNRAGLLQRLLLRYAQAHMTIIFQTAACNRHHPIEQQLCQWLLSTVDRIPDRELVMTQELIASMIGVRRESITQAAGILQAAGCITYRRGHITVLDRKALEARVCECYCVVKNERIRLMSGVR